MIAHARQVFEDEPEHNIQAGKNAAILLGGTHRLSKPTFDKLDTDNGRAVMFVTSRGVYLVMFVARVQGKGVGRKLMRELIDHCTHLKRRRIIVTLQSCLREHDGFYEKMGFQMSSDKNPSGMVEFTYDLPSSRKSNN